MNEECREVGHSLRNLKLVLVDHWEKLVRNEIISSRHEKSVVLQDHVAEILDGLIQILEEGEINEVEVGKAHGFHRAVLTKFTVQDILTEFSLLRQTIIDYLYPLGEVQCSKLVHRYLDIISKNSVVEFLYDLPLVHRVERAEPGSETDELKKHSFITPS